MINEGLIFTGILEWKHWNGENELISEGIIHNQIQDELFQEAIDALQGGTWDNPIVALGIGTGTGQNTTDTVLSSIVSHVAGGGGLTLSQTSASVLQAVGMFTDIRNTPTITEASLNGDSSASDHMYAYNDGLSVSIGGTSDTLQITWTITASV